MTKATFWVGLLLGIGNNRREEELETLVKTMDGFLTPSNTNKEEKFELGNNIWLFRLVVQRNTSTSSSRWEHSTWLDEFHVTSEK